MQVDVLTLFPGMFAGVFEWSIVKRAMDKSLLKMKVSDLRDWATDKYKSVDDRPYGGGAGMIMRVDVIDKAVEETRKPGSRKARVVLLDAGGEQYTQKKAEQLAQTEELILICGHYEGVDHRVHEHIADEVISVGPYVLSGGEIPAMTLVDSIVRLLPGALGNPDSLKEESFTDSQAIAGTGYEYSQYTRPVEYKGWKVPEVLLSGNHKEISAWRKSGSS